MLPLDCVEATPSPMRRSGLGDAECTSSKRPSISRARTLDDLDDQRILGLIDSLGGRDVDIEAMLEEVAAESEARLQLRNRVLQAAGYQRLLVVVV